MKNQDAIGRLVSLKVVHFTPLLLDSSAVSRELPDQRNTVEAKVPHRRLVPKGWRRSVEFVLFKNLSALLSPALLPQNVVTHCCCVVAVDVAVLVAVGVAVAIAVPVGVVEAGGGAQ